MSTYFGIHGRLRHFDWICNLRWLLGPNIFVFPPPGSRNFSNHGFHHPTDFSNPSLPLQIGKCDLIEQVMIGDETLLKFSGVPLGEACSIVIRGATEQGCNSIDIWNLWLDLGRK